MAYSTPPITFYHCRILTDVFPGLLSIRQDPQTLSCYQLFILGRRLMEKSQVQG